MYCRMLVIFVACTVACGFGATTGSAAIVADSIAQFSGFQGQDNWFYGFYNQGRLGGLPHGYTVGDFTPFDTFDNPSWRAGDAQVGAENNDFLDLNQFGGHPNGLDVGQTSLIWAVRRYQSEINGLVDIAFDLHKMNVVEPRGGGITGRIFVDGVEVWTKFIENLDSQGAQGVRTYKVSLGSLIDFAIDPTSDNAPSGESPFSARADGSQFSAIIATHPIPEPSTILLLGIGVVTMTARALRVRLHAT